MEVLHCVLQVVEARARVGGVSAPGHLQSAAPQKGLRCVAGPCVSSALACVELDCSDCWPQQSTRLHNARAWLWPARAQGAASWGRLLQCADVGCCLLSTFSSLLRLVQRWQSHWPCQHWRRVWHQLSSRDSLRSRAAVCVMDGSEVSQQAAAHR